MERFPTEHDLIEARDHLAALLYTVKTYLPLPVVMSPQPAGEPAGGIHRGVFLCPGPTSFMFWE